MDLGYFEVDKEVQKNTLEARKTESDRILKKFPNRIPIVTEKCGDNPDIPLIDKNKFLVPKDLTLGQYAYVIRKRLKLNSEHGIFYFINNKMLPMGDNIANIYHNEKDDDGFLYISYGGENTFG